MVYKLPDFCHLSSTTMQDIQHQGGKKGSSSNQLVAVISDPPLVTRNSEPAVHRFPDWWEPNIVHSQSVVKNLTKDRSTVQDICSRSEGLECFCPLPSWNLSRVSAETVCEKLAGKTMLLAGSSILRDMWNALALWLLQRDGIRLLDEYVNLFRSVSTHHGLMYVCTVCNNTILFVRVQLRGKRSRCLLRKRKEDASVAEGECFVVQHCRGCYC